MPRPTQSIEAIIQGVVSQAMQKSALAIQRHIVALAAEELEKNLAVKTGLKMSRGPARHARARREDITRWVADRRARRVPKFVIDLTGLDTKKKIVAKFGANTAFEKGKPLPKAAKAA
jgi:chromosome condensin MukBEF complex kleisin-like MukF subunit